MVAGQARSHSNTRLTLGEFIADVLISKDTKDNCCYFVIQRIGSAEVVELARFDSFEKAEEAANQSLERLLREHPPNQDVAC